MQVLNLIPILISEWGGSFLFDYSIPLIYDAFGPRGARLDCSGLFQHVMAGGIKKRLIFLMTRIERHF
ncbi:MAG: hypothetical protein AMJ94_00120 [Deltaproteobacteria bacterium SM23_61]|nr:MAG: hypothetical protein AMJ94_00120 [Deltaproteobacteria bacterium SM23_61]